MTNTTKTLLQYIIIKGGDNAILAKAILELEAKND